MRNIQLHLYRDQWWCETRVYVAVYAYICTMVWNPGLCCSIYLHLYHDVKPEFMMQCIPRSVPWCETRVYDAVYTYICTMMWDPGLWCTIQLYICTMKWDPGLWCTIQLYICTIIWDQGLWCTIYLHLYHDVRPRSMLQYIPTGWDTYICTMMWNLVPP